MNRLFFIYYFFNNGCPFFWRSFEIFFGQFRVNFSRFTSIGFQNSANQIEFFTSQSDSEIEFNHLKTCLILRHLPACQLLLNSDKIAVICATVNLSCTGLFCCKSSGAALPVKTAARIEKKPPKSGWMQQPKSFFPLRTSGKRF